MILFRNEDAAYFAWLEANPAGRVVNSYRRPTPTYLVLHRADCRHIQQWEGRTLTGGDYAKVCAGEAGELHEWAQEIGGALTPCGSYQP